MHSHTYRQLSGAMQAFDLIHSIEHVLEKLVKAFLFNYFDRSAEANNESGVTSWLTFGRVIQIRLMLR